MVVLPNFGWREKCLEESLRRREGVGSVIGHEKLMSQVRGWVVDTPLEVADADSRVAQGGAE